MFLNSQFLAKKLSEIANSAWFFTLKVSLFVRWFFVNRPSLSALALLLTVRLLMRFCVALLTIGFVFAIIVLVIKIAYKYFNKSLCAEPPSEWLRCVLRGWSRLEQTADFGLFLSLNASDQCFLLIVKYCKWESLFKTSSVCEIADW